MPIPDYLVCLECEAPCYDFEWDDEDGKIRQALCHTCGTDDPEQFASPEDLDEGY